MQIPQEVAVDAQPRFIFATPSHQYPLGSIMPLSRRMQLVAIAKRWGSWVVEDDYDSEFRYSGQPISSLKGLDADAPVIYLGTFSKTLFPGLRVAYMVLPRGLVAPFQAGLAELYREGHLMTQAALATFITQGHYASHIRRMRVLYSRRRNMLANLIERRLGPEWLNQEGSEAGLHLVLNFPRPLKDTEVAADALSRGILVKPLSTYYANAAQSRQGLLLGYGCVPVELMTEQFELLLQSIDAVSRRS
jgi:GntR family transcriptional regulator/MocR family aminotransferase